MSLGARSAAAARWMGASNVVRAVARLAQVIILTRFLAPADYGLMAVVMVVIGYGSLFSDLGLSTAFVQRQRITQKERSSLYWLSVGIGFGVMMAVIAASPLAAALFQMPELATPLSLVSSNFLVVSLGQQLRMDAEKALNFRPVALIEIVSALSGLAVAVMTGWLGWGVYALAAGAMLTAWMSTLLFWTFLAKGWRPSWHFRWADVRWFIRFGGGMVVTNIANQVNATVDLLLGGRLLGAEQLGLYSVPRNLTLQVQGAVNPIFTRVGFPVIASIQTDTAQVRRVYLKIMNLTATVNAPIYIGMGVFAPELVSVLLGSEFKDSAPLLSIIAIWGLLRSFANPAGSLVFGMGRVRLALFWNLGLLLIVPPALWVGAQFGPTGLAGAMAVVMGLMFVPGWALLVRPTCGLRLSRYSSEVWRPTLCGLIAGMLAWITVASIDSATIRLGMGLMIGAIAYGALSWHLNPRGIELARGIWQRPMR